MEYSFFHRELIRNIIFVVSGLLSLAFINVAILVDHIFLRAVSLRLEMDNFFDACSGLS